MIKAYNDAPTGLRTAFVGGQSVTFAPSTKVDTAPAVYHGRLHEDVLYTGNMAMDRSAARAVGVFDERLGPGTSFPSAEDNDFGFRLLEAGYRIVYVPEALLYHRAWRSERDYVRLRWSYGAPFSSVAPAGEPGPEPPPG